MSGRSARERYAAVSVTTRPLVLAGPAAPPPVCAVSRASVSWFLRLSSASCCSLRGSGAVGDAGD